MSEKNETDAEDPKGLVFPCDFPLRVIGENSEIFEQEVIETLTRHGVEVDPSKLTIKTSSNKNFCSLGYTFIAQSREQMDEIYRELTANERVKWVL